MGFCGRRLVSSATRTSQSASHFFALLRSPVTASSTAVSQQPSSAEWQGRAPLLLMAALLAMWCWAVRHPQLSYPADAISQIPLLCLLTLLCALVERRDAKEAGAERPKLSAGNRFAPAFGILLVG